jgi:Mce-associated membrane protein
MRGSVFDSPTVLEPGGHVADEELDTHSAVAAENGRLRTVLVTVGVLVLVLLLVVGGSLWQRRSANARLDDTREQVVGVARQEAVNLMSISYNTASADLARILKLAAGSVAKQFASQRGTINNYLGQAKSTSRGQVKSAGLQSLGKDRAIVLVAADATVSNNESSGAGLKDVVKHYRMSMTLQRVHGQWLVSDIGFDGAAQ